MWLVTSGNRFSQSRRPTCGQSKRCSSWPSATPLELPIGTRSAKNGNRTREDRRHGELKRSLLSGLPLIRAAKQPTDSGLEEAQILLNQLEKERPYWAASRTLTGLLRETQRRRDEAIQAYGEAINLGEQRLAVYERLLTLLYTSERFDEAQKLLGRLGDHVSASTSLSSLALLDAARTQQTAAALTIAKRGVAVRPADPFAWLWLASLLESLSRKIRQLARRPSRHCSGPFSWHPVTSACGTPFSPSMGVSRTPRR